jgi:hypothetical protein
MAIEQQQYPLARSHLLEFSHDSNLKQNDIFDSSNFLSAKLLQNTNTPQQSSDMFSLNNNDNNNHYNHNNNRFKKGKNVDSGKKGVASDDTSSTRQYYKKHYGESGRIKIFYYRRKSKKGHSLKKIFSVDSNEVDSFGMMHENLITPASHHQKKERTHRGGEEEEVESSNHGGRNKSVQSHKEHEGLKSDKITRRDEQRGQRISAEEKTVPPFKTCTDLC